MALIQGECLQILRGHYHQIYAVAFDGKRIASGSMDSTVCIWAADTGELLALLQGHTALVGQVQLNGLSNVLVTGGSDGRVVIFCLETFECLHRLCAHDNSVTCLQFDDRFVVTGGNDGRVKLWDFQVGISPWLYFRSSEIRCILVDVRTGFFLCASDRCIHSGVGRTLRCGLEHYPEGRQGDFAV